MLYKRFPPADVLKQFVECYWVIESDDTIPIKQKIIPDGFPELIFHYKDGYKININKHWELQPKSLIAGQIRKHFFLENTGRSGVLGIKLRPSSLTHLFGISMNIYTDSVVPIKNAGIRFLNDLADQIAVCTHYMEMIDVAERELKTIASNINQVNTTIDKILNFIFSSNGTTPIALIQKELFVTERQVQRMFQKYVGLSPKLYSRIIRFNHIFELVQKKNISLMEITHKAGYFDQSHFIRDFKNFTGEDPSRYSFSESNLANFFLKK